MPGLQVPLLRPTEGRVWLQLPKNWEKVSGGPGGPRQEGTRHTWEIKNIKSQTEEGQVPHGESSGQCLQKCCYSTQKGVANPGGVWRTGPESWNRGRTACFRVTVRPGGGDHKKPAPHSCRQAEVRGKSLHHKRTPAARLLKN